MQTKEWQKLQNDLNETSFFEEGNDFQFLAILKHTPVGNYLYLPYGPVYENKKGLNNALRKLKELAKENSAIFIRIEPRDSKFTDYAPKNAKKSTDLNPKETWVLKLDKGYREKLPSRLLRYHRNAEKNGIKITTSHNPDDIHYLLDLQKALAEKKGINTFSEEYLKTELAQPFSTLYLVEYQPADSGKKEIIAAGLVFDDKTTRYNLQGAQSEEARRLHATGILTIQLIIDAAENGKKEFDFWGIAPEGASKNHPWAGFTAFKKTFAGEERDYAGTFDIIENPAKYRLYNLTRKINRLRRRI